MKLSRNDKKQLEQFIIFIFALFLIAVFTAVVAPFIIDSVGNIFGYEGGQRIYDALTIDVPSLLIEYSGLTIPVLIIIAAYFFLQFREYQRGR